MAKTAVADIIIPTEFEKYAIERTAELSAFGQSGIVESAPEFDELAMGGGREVHHAGLRPASASSTTRASENGRRSPATSW